jgi:long-chain acyl-CoA synthetase
MRNALCFMVFGHRQPVFIRTCENRFMSTSAPEMLALQRLYHWEKTAPGRIALTQPMGAGVTKDFTWAEVADQVRRMATHLKSQGWEPG